MNWELFDVVSQIGEILEDQFHLPVSKVVVLEYDPDVDVHFYLYSSIVSKEVLDYIEQMEFEVPVKAIRVGKDNKYNDIFIGVWLECGGNDSNNSERD